MTCDNWEFSAVTNVTERVIESSLVSWIHLIFVSASQKVQEFRDTRLRKIEIL